MWEGWEWCEGKRALYTKYEGGLGEDASSVIRLSWPLSWPYHMDENTSKATAAVFWVPSA